MRLLSNFILTKTRTNFPAAGILDKRQNLKFWTKDNFPRAYPTCNPSHFAESGLLGFRITYESATREVMFLDNLLLHNRFLVWLWSRFYVFMLENRYKLRSFFILKNTILSTGSIH